MCTTPFFLIGFDRPRWTCGQCISFMKARGPFLCFFVCLLYHIASRVIELCTGDICFIDSTSQPDSCFIYTVLLLSEGKIFRPILPHRDMVWTWGLEGQWNTEWPRILSGLYRVLYILVSIHKPTNQKLLLLSLGLVIVRPLFVIRAREYPRWPAPPFHLARAYKVDSTKEMLQVSSFPPQTIAGHLFMTELS